MTNLLPIIAQADIPVPSAVIQYGMAGAVIVVVFLFLRFLREEREDRKVERESFIAAINKSSDATDKLSRRIEHCPVRNYDMATGERKAEIP